MTSPPDEARCRILIVGDELWVVARRGRYTGLVVASAAQSPGLLLDRLDSALRAAEEARQRDEPGAAAGVERAEPVGAGRDDEEAAEPGAGDDRVGAPAVGTGGGFAGAEPDGAEVLRQVHARAGAGQGRDVHCLSRAREGA